MLGGKRPVFAITPTYRRVLQLQQITSVAQALMLDGGVYWIVIEDAPKPTAGMRKFLNETGLPFSHLAVTSLKDKRFRGSNQRNAGIAVVESLCASGVDGVMYFADDDNAYDHRLFDMLRELEKDVGLLATGLTGGGNFERCIVNKAGTVIGFASNFDRKTRKFAVDMAGMAIRTTIFKRLPGWRISLAKVGEGHMETAMLESIIKHKRDAQALGGCIRVLFWHLSKTPDWISNAFKKPVEGASRDPRLASFPLMPKTPPKTDPP